jgi:hypothetical protein
MKNVCKIIGMVFLLLNNTVLLSQAFFKAQQSAIMPTQVLFENYTMLMLPEGNGKDLALNRFDNRNPYTFIQLIRDREGREYHILFQTDFFGKILLLAYSNNLHPVFNRKEKPFFALQHCINSLNSSLFSLENSASAINCILQRLNYCSE